jgi:hypothetical protein
MNVTLSAWKNTGSDKVTKTIIVRNNPVEIPDQNTLNTTSGTEGTSNISN